MPKKPANGQLTLFEVEDYLKTTPCVPLLRQKVGAWREEGYPGATDVTKKLLAWWFMNDHRLSDGRLFTYHRAQRDAIETLIYAYEVARVRSRRELYEQFARTDEQFPLPPDDDFARFATKMATGSGNTKVMSLAIAWQYFNAVMGGGDDYARTFLIIAPNVIVLERLAEDFTGGRIFRADPVMPHSMRYYYPDFVAIAADGTYWIIKTKGTETVEVQHKDNATQLTGVNWEYINVPQKDFGDITLLGWA